MSKRKRILPYIPDEVIIDSILIRLPVKLVGRCRIVSKTWRSLLSSSQFARTHLNYQPEGAILERTILSFALWTSKLPNKERSYSKVTLPDSLFMQMTVKPRLIGSCHGLVLIHYLGIHIDSMVRFFRSSKLILINPTTLETVEVADLCDAYLCEHSLGYDSSKDDYKIVSRGKDSHVRIYSVRTNTWRTLGKSPYHFSLDGGKFVNGCIHWLVTSYKKVALAAFNLAREEFEKLPLPSDLGGTDHFDGRFTLDVVGECLALLDIWDPSCVMVWVMKKYGVQNSWTKHSVELPNETSRLTAYGFLGEDEVSLRNFECKSIACNWRNGVPRVIKDSKFVWIKKAIAFRESLISPNSYIQ